MVTHKEFERDVLETGAGDLEITFLGHGTLMFAYDGKTIHVDPYSRVADYRQLPDADIVLVTHEHRDHLDPDALDKIVTRRTEIIGNAAAAQQLDDITVMRPGDTHKIQGIEIAAVPAYNIEHTRPNGDPFHPQGVGNGYILTFGDLRVYVAGDTESTPEMQALTGIDVAFLPMNLPYTMTPGEVAEAARAFKPRILYPYHFGDTDTNALVQLLDGSDIEVRVRDLA
jgi:L-ascorbate metabolism protein UlaG (beta-lactamase superfamily)